VTGAPVAADIGAGTANNRSIEIDAALKKTAPERPSTLSDVVRAAPRTRRVSTPRIKASAWPVDRVDLRRGYPPVRTM
jgi:hypothetical protein